MQMQEQMKLIELSRLASENQTVCKRSANANSCLAACNLHALLILRVVINKKSRVETFVWPVREIAAHQLQIWLCQRVLRIDKFY